jgi:hypothetical protein
MREAKLGLVVIGLENGMNKFATSCKIGDVLKISCSYTHYYKYTLMSNVLLTGHTNTPGCTRGNLRAKFLCKSLSFAIFAGRFRLPWRSIYGLTWWRRRIVSRYRRRLVHSRWRRIIIRK